MVINETMMQEAILTYPKQDHIYHFMMAKDNSEFTTVAIATFAKNFFGEVLACLPTSYLKLDMIPRGYIVTSLFVYCDEVKPIFIYDMKSVIYQKGLLVIEYHNGGKRNYEGGTFVKELYGLLTKLVQDTPVKRDYTDLEILKYCILTYDDDGGFEFELAYQKQRELAASIYGISEEDVVGYMDTSMEDNLSKGFVVTLDRIYSEFFTSHDQEPIDLNHIESVEVKRNRLIIYYKDGRRELRYCSIYGNDLKNLIDLYHKNKRK